MPREWIGGKRIAFIPTWNAQVDQRPPDNWPDQIAQRIYFYPDGNTGLDGSISAWVRTASSGRAWIEPQILPTVEAPDADVMGAALASLPSGHGFDLAVSVIPHSVGEHRGGFFWSEPGHSSGVNDFCRVAMFADTAMGNDATVGVWAMEILHAVTHFGDLYFTSPAMGRFDIMSCACGPHPSAHTKSHFGWLSDAAIRDHSLGLQRAYDLHAIGLQRPLPPSRRRAIRVPSKVHSGHFMIEARLRNDQFDGMSFVSNGVPSEGVIVYEVRGTTEVYLLTSSALGNGQSLEIEGEDLRIRVQAEIPGGFTVGVKSKGKDQCTILWNSIKSIQQSLEIETDLQRRKQLISALQRAKKKVRQLRCKFLLNPPDVAFLDQTFGAPPPRGGKPKPDYPKAK